MLLDFTKNMLNKGINKGWSEDDFIENCGFKQRKDFYNKIGELFGDNQEELNEKIKQIKINNKNVYQKNKKNNNYYDFKDDFFIPVLQDDMCVYPKIDYSISESLDIIISSLGDRKELGKEKVEGKCLSDDSKDG